MMEWAFIILLVTAALLLVLSFYQLKKSSKEEQRQLDTMYFSLNDEIVKLQQQVRELELDKEVMEHAANPQLISFEERVLLREMLDLYKRGYTMDGIAANKNIDRNKVEDMLTPYISIRDERGVAANES